MEKIVVNPTYRRLLVKKYGACNVSKALNFYSNSLMAREIRQEAMNECEGVLYKY